MGGWVSGEEEECKKEGGKKEKGERGRREEMRRLRRRGGGGGKRQVVLSVETIKGYILVHLLFSPSLCTPPIPPVTNTSIPALWAHSMVADTVVPPQ